MADGQVSRADPNNFKIINGKLYLAREKGVLDQTLVKPAQRGWVKLIEQN